MRSGETRVPGGAGEKKKSGPGTEEEFEEEETSDRGWFFCVRRQSSAVTGKGVRRRVEGKERRVKVAVEVSWGATSGSEW